MFSHTLVFNLIEKECNLPKAKSCFENKKAPRCANSVRGKVPLTKHHCILNSKQLDTRLAYVCLLDLVRKPRAVCRLVDDVDAFREDVDPWFHAHVDECSLLHE